VGRVRIFLSQQRRNKFTDVWEDKQIVAAKRVIYRRGEKEFGGVAMIRKLTRRRRTMRDTIYTTKLCGAYRIFYVEFGPAKKNRGGL